MTDVRSALLASLTASLLCASSALFAADPGAEIALRGASHPGAVACTSCHGSDGGGNAESGFPRLAGLNATYLERQLHAYQQGSNKNPVMAEMAGSLTNQEISEVSAYYAGLQPVSHAKAPADVAVATGEQLARYGDMPARGLPPCVQCHGPGGLGVGSVFPPLAGQPYQYIVDQINAWQSGLRSGDPLGLMKQVASLLTAEVVRSVAAYYAAQPVQGEGGNGTIAAREATGTKPERAEQATPPHQMAPQHQSTLPHLGAVEPGREVGPEGYFEPPPHGGYPDGPFGEKVRLGEAIFVATNTNPESGKYVGNEQVCQGCHLDAGRLANSAPMWASWVAYPAYRKKTKSVNTQVQRIQGCFKYSMNAQGSEVGHEPDAESDVIVALMSYMYWVATGAPTGDQQMAGRGYKELAETREGFDPDRGKPVYQSKCAVCHGENGEGQFAQGEVVFPPLWGPRSYNWGAGMHKINTAASYIRLNMPLGLASAAQNKAWLSDQEAWDVAAYMNSHERPQDPRFAGSVAETAKSYHDSKYDYYGKLKGRNGKLLGEGAPLH
jgi:thiosulfate dehydrogenase